MLFGIFIQDGFISMRLGFLSKMAAFQYVNYKNDAKSTREINLFEHGEEKCHGHRSHPRFRQQEQWDPVHLLRRVEERSSNDIPVLDAISSRDGIAREGSSLRTTLT